MASTQSLKSTVRTTNKEEDLSACPSAMLETSSNKTIDFKTPNFIVYQTINIGVQNL